MILLSLLLAAGQPNPPEEPDGRYFCAMERRTSYGWVTATTSFKPNGAFVGRSFRVSEFVPEKWRSKVKGELDRKALIGFEFQLTSDRKASELALEDVHEMNVNLAFHVSGKPGKSNLAAYVFGPDFAGTGRSPYLKLAPENSIFFVGNGSFSLPLKTILGLANGGDHLGVLLDGTPYQYPQDRNVDLKELKSRITEAFAMIGQLEGDRSDFKSRCQYSEPSEEPEMNDM